jgi:predicted AAA+ superfamily ATPase
MKRAIDQTLDSWKQDPQHPVLMVRGARQVGKTYSIRNLGRSFEYLLEVNFEEKDEVKTFFDGSRSPQDIIEKLSAYYGVPVVPGKTLVFFDEIQACPNCLRSLRFFYEKIPSLHVVAAGSLLEFALEQIPSFGVGRISSVFMYPLSFNEFLQAIGMEGLSAIICKASVVSPVDPVLHKKTLEHLRTYLAIGGMPAVVESYAMTHDLRKCMQLLDRLLSGFKDDFSKYRHRSPVQRLVEVFESVALQSGGKFKYSTVNPDLSHYELKLAFELLEKAGLLYRVWHTDARGIPIGAQTNPRRFKALPFDIGIFQRIMNLDLPAYIVQSEAELVNKGAVAEIFVGLEIIAASAPDLHPKLYYWHREARSSNAEVDYVIQQGNIIVPVEVKSGVRGAMQSMHLFLAERKLQRGVRLSHENYSRYGAIETAPLYTAGNLVKHT